MVTYLKQFIFNQHVFFQNRFTDILTSLEPLMIFKMVAPLTVSLNFKRNLTRLILAFNQINIKMLRGLKRYSSQIYSLLIFLFRVSE